MISEASSKQRSACAARRWNNRSPGVDTAQWRAPSSSLKGWSSAGRGPANSRSQASEPMPVTRASPAVGTLNPTVRPSAERSTRSSRTTSSAPGSIVATRNSAAAVSGVSTAWGSWSRTGEAPSVGVVIGVAYRRRPSEQVERTNWAALANGTSRGTGAGPSAGDLATGQAGFDPLPQRGLGNGADLATDDLAALHQQQRRDALDLESTRK